MIDRQYLRGSVPGGRLTDLPCPGAHVVCPRLRPKGRGAAPLAVANSRMPVPLTGSQSRSKLLEETLTCNIDIGVPVP